MKYDFVVVLHRLYDNGNIKKGGVDLIVDYLLKKNKTILLIEYPLDYKQSNQMRVSQLTYNETKPLYYTPVFIRVSVISWIIEFFLTLTTISRYSAVGGVIITGDPLATLPAILLRKAGMFKFHYYHSIDYSTKRFKNPLLNSLYTKILKMGVKSADLVGVVSRPAVDRLAREGVKRTIFIPNSMDYHSLDKIRKPVVQRKHGNLVITCSEVSNKYLIKDLVMLTQKLKEKYESIHLDVVGRFDSNSTYCKELTNYVNSNNLQDTITFHGQVDREANYQIISQSYIGLAFYDGLHSHVMFGDALKIREYSAFGLPTVADSHTPTAVEMNEVSAGFTVSGFNEAYNKIDILLSDINNYNRVSECALRWAKKFDKKKILDDLYARYF